MTATQHAFPTVVPVAIADLERLLELVEVADALEPADRSAIGRLRTMATAGVQAQAAHRDAHGGGLFDRDQLAAQQEAAGNVLAGPGPHLPASHRGGHDTEVGAARAIDLKAGTLRARVLAELVRVADTGATDVELERALDLTRPTGGNRRGELVKLHLVERAPHGRTRTVGNHRPAVVWVATEAGVAAAKGLGYRITGELTDGHAIAVRTMLDPDSEPLGTGRLAEFTGRLSPAAELTARAEADLARIDPRGHVRVVGA